MKVSEKTLELNVGAELLEVIRSDWGLPKAYLRGLTQREEKAEGVDSFLQLSPSAQLFAFQFKAPLGKREGPPYRYRLHREQHSQLYALAVSSPAAVFYVFPYYLGSNKLQRDVPVLLRDTWILRVARMPTKEVFKNQRTKVILCDGARAFVNPSYDLENLARGHASAPHYQGVNPERFSAWYRQFWQTHSPSGKRRNPWLVRGLRVVICEPERRNRNQGNPSLFNNLAT